MSFKLTYIAALLFPIIANAQNGATVVSGNLIPGHLTMGIANGVIGDAGPALGGPPGTNPFELGITNTGTPFCITDGPITGPYHQLCLGANAIGGGLISYNSYGGALPLPLQCLINGASYNCLGTSGGGNVTGPSSSTVGNIAIFNSSNGKLISDSGISISSFGNITGPNTSSLGFVPGWANTIGTLLGNTPATLALANNTPIHGAAGPLNSAIWDIITLSGTSNSSTVLQLPQGYVQPKNYISCPIDTVNAPPISGAPIDVQCFSISEVVGGGNEVGSRSPLAINLDIPSNAGSTLGSDFYPGAITTETIRANQGGVSTVAPVGNVYSIVGQLTAETGATFLSSLGGAEFDVGMQVGTSANLKWGVLVLGGFNETGGGTRAFFDDVGYWLNTNTSGNFKTGFEISDGVPGHWPITNTGTIMGVNPAQAGIATAALGIDFTAVTFSACAFAIQTLCIQDSLPYSLFTNRNATSQLGFVWNNAGKGTILIAANALSGATIANHITILGEQTGTGPVIGASGSDTNVDIGFTTQGAGTLRLNGNAGVTCAGSPTSSFTSYRGVVTHC